MGHKTKTQESCAVRTIERIAENLPALRGERAVQLLDLQGGNAELATTVDQFGARRHVSEHGYGSSLRRRGWHGLWSRTE